MSKRDEYIAFINEFKTVSPTITEEQRKGLLKRAVQQHGISVDEASDILNASGLAIGEKIDYFEVFGFAIEDLQNQSEASIINRVESAHKKLYGASLTAGGRPRADGRTEEQWRTLLNQARETLIDPHKRREYVAVLQRNEVDMQFEGEASSIIELSDVDKTISQGLSQQIEPPDIDVPDGMVYIPAGEFRMGSNDADANEDEHPVHAVFVDAFLMDKYPVTNAQYKIFLDANPQWHKPMKWGERDRKLIAPIANKYHDGDYLKHWTYGIYPSQEADHPVIWVSWYAAMAYAEWVGKRLSTEAEWEKAARGGRTGLKYPWGNSIDFSRANYGSKVGKTTSVSAYPANSYGLYDMVGNVREWCLDKWDKRFYVSSPRNNPVSDGSIIDIMANFASVRTSRVLRGGSWVSAPKSMRVASRSGDIPFSTSINVGFRCVKEVIS